MYALDFEYDGQLLSQYGFLICEIDGSSGVAIADTGYQISFNKVKQNNGRKHGLTNTSYDSCLQSTFHICKDPEYNNSLEITNDEYRDIVRWLNRHEFLPFRFINEIEHDKDTCFFNASFNIRKIYISDKFYGLELTVETDSPYGYGWPVRYEWRLSKNEVVEFYDYSDDAAFIRPDMVITCNQPGNLLITNTLTGSAMKIDNCSKGEVIRIYGEAQVITTSLQSHAVYDDFNYEFLRIGNTYHDRKNVLRFSLPCTCIMEYKPIIKDIPH